MNNEAQPVIVAFDGSAEAQEAVRTAARLFGHRPLLVVTAWEPELGRALMSMSDAPGLPYVAPNPEALAEVDRAEEEHATAAADAGARLARELGSSAESLALKEGTGIADTIAAIAADRDAAAIVVGSRGLGRVKSALLGSTSQSLIRETTRPVLIVRPPQ